MTLRPTVDLDGVWWPRSLNLAAELVPLLLRLQDDGYKITHVLYNPMLWDNCPASVRLGRRRVKLGGSGQSDSPSVTLLDSVTGEQLDLVVMAPATNPTSNPEASAAGKPGPNYIEFDEGVPRAHLTAANDPRPSAASQLSGSATDVVAQSIIGTDPTGRVTMFDLGAQRLLGYTEEEMIGRQYSDLHDPLELTELAVQFSDGAAEQSHDAWTYLSSEGTRIMVGLSVRPTHDSSGRLSGYVVVGTPQMINAPMSQAPLTREMCAGPLWNLAPVALAMVAIVDQKPSQLLAVNEAFCMMMGMPSESLVDRVLDTVLTPDRASTELGSLATQSFAGARNVNGRRHFTRPGGRAVSATISSTLISEAGTSPTTLLCAFSDIYTEGVGNLVRSDALRDPLTGLPTDAVLRDRVSHGLAATTRSHSPIGLISIGLDGWDTLGPSGYRAITDDDVTHAAATLLAVVRPGDTVAHLDGGHFAVICMDIADLSSLHALASRILRAVSTQTHVAAPARPMGASVGLRLADDRTDCDQLLADAYAAMREARVAGSNLVIAAHAAA